jgi:hypothetical protein
MDHLTSELAWLHSQDPYRGNDWVHTTDGSGMHIHILVRLLFPHIPLEINIFVMFFVLFRSLAICYLFKNSLVKMTSLLNVTLLMFLSRTKPPRTYFLDVTAAAVFMHWMCLSCVKSLLVFEFHHLCGTHVLVIRPRQLSVMFFIVMSFLQCLVIKMSRFVMRVSTREESSTSFCFV